MSGAQRQNGMALVLVLWLIVLLSVMAAGHSRNSHIETRLAARQVDASAARHAAEAAVQLAILDLIETHGDDRIDTSGKATRLHVMGREATLAVRRANGYIDINGASENLLHALFLATGAGDADARRLAQAVMDWRDTDGLVRMQGAEDADYQLAGMPWSARDAAFTRVEELQYVYGMPGSIYRAALPFVTVHSGRDGIDLDAAPAALRDALATTGSSRFASAGSDNGHGPYHITVSVHGGNGTLVSVEAVVVIGGSRDNPFETLEWREHARELPAPEEDTTA